MMDQQLIDAGLLQKCMVFPDTGFRVDVGVYIGESLTQQKEAMIGDIYRLSRRAQLEELVIDASDMTVSSESSIGTAHTEVTITARNKLMSTRGCVVEVLSMVAGSEHFLLPLGPLTSGEDYTLMARAVTDKHAQHDLGLSQGFTKGSQIITATGAPKNVEELRVGDPILTRNNGVQKIRWIGHKRERAEGNRAPVVILKGALNNARDMVIAPDHRVFVYQRNDRIGAGRAEVLVRARLLINGDTIYSRAPGFIDYYHLLFDGPEVIYVEGAQAESLHVNAQTLAGFSDVLRSDLQKHLTPLHSRSHRGVEPTARDLMGLDTAKLLKSASRS